MNGEFKREVMECMAEFAHVVRMHRQYKDEQLMRLKSLLSDLAGELRKENVIDKDIALNLYSLPQIVRNMSLTFEGAIESRQERFNRLEDAWVDLEAFVIDCLQPYDA
jgi:hypothetical protein